MVKTICVRMLTKAYKTSKKNIVYALNSISFDVDEKNIFGIIGPNGSGKTTLIRSICGLLSPDSGIIEIFGRNILESKYEILKNIGVVFEGHRNLFRNLSVMENIIFFTNFHGKNIKQVYCQLIELLEKFNLIDKKNDIVQSLSQGMQQKLSIIIALIRNPKLIILDEPTTGLDIATSLEIISLIKEMSCNLGKTIIMTSHDMKFIEKTCHRLLIIDSGCKVSCDTMQNLKKHIPKDAYIIKFHERLTGQSLEVITGLGCDIVWYQANAYLLDTNLISMDMILDCFEKLSLKIEAFEHISTSLEGVYSYLLKKRETDD